MAGCGHKKVPNFVSLEFCSLGRLSKMAHAILSANTLLKRSKTCVFLLLFLVKKLKDLL